jgi:hypothetical protein
MHIRDSKRVNRKAFIRLKEDLGVRGIEYTPVIKQLRNERVYALVGQGLICFG